MQKLFKIALCQSKATENKVKNISEAYRLAKQAKKLGPDVVVFGEYFTNVVHSARFQEYSEPVLQNLNEGYDLYLNDIISLKKSFNLDDEFETIMKSPTPAFLFLKALSYFLDLLVVGGSLVEKEDNRLYNTCFIFDKGELLGRHRKVHLFDVDIPGKMTFKESETVSPGNTPTLIKTRFGNFGIGICYDIRFASYAMYLRELGADVLIYPSVFNQETGPRHFLLSGQARALDTQCYVILGSCAQYTEKPEYYQAYGHSAIVNADGKIIEHLKGDEGVLFNEVNLNTVDEIRKTIPYTSDHQKRKDIYGFKNLN